MKNEDGILVRIPEEKSPLEKPRLRMQNNIKMKLRVLGLVAMHWINLVEGVDSWRACVNAVINIRVTKTAENVCSSSRTTSFYSMTLLC